MDQNLISAEISPADALTVEQLLAQAREKLPFLLTLSPNSDRTLPKLETLINLFWTKQFKL